MTFLRFKLFFCSFIIVLSLLAGSAAKADNLDDIRNFLVDSSYDFNNRSSIDATLKKISIYAFFYVENEYYNSLNFSERSQFDSNIGKLAENFDKTIYPNIRNNFGKEWNPGIDNMEHVTILFTKTKENVGGYFNPNDEYFKSEVVDEKSNEREMLYLNAIFSGNERIESFLAHEFQHMITWYHKTKLKNLNEDTWLNEARSEYASTAIGYDDIYLKSNLRARVENFMQNQTDSLTEWQNKIQDYSSVNLFSQYLADHFGADLFQNIIGNDLVGIESIDKALNDIGYTNLNLQDIFINWTVANYLNNKYYLDGKFGYMNPNLAYDNFHFKPTSTYSVGKNGVSVKISETVKDWSSRYYEIKPAENSSDFNVSLSFNGDNSGKFSVSYILLSKNGIISVNTPRLDSSQDGTYYIKNFGKSATSMIVIPSSHEKRSGFGNQNNSYSFFLSIDALISAPYPDGSLLKSYRNPEVYLIENGKKRWISSSAALISNGYRWENIIYVESNELDFFEQGDSIISKNLRSDGTLIRGNGPKVYLIENGKKRWITSADVFAKYGYKWENIVAAQNIELNSYLDGPDIKTDNIKADGTLIRGNGPKVYLIENGKKRWITSADVFAKYGYKWENIVIVSEDDIISYPDGINVDN